MCYGSVSDMEVLGLCGSIPSHRQSAQCWRVRRVCSCSVLVNDPGRMTMSPIGQWWRVRFFMPLGLHQNSDFIFLYLFTHWLKKSHTMFSAEWCHFCGSVNTVKHFFSFELLDNFWLNQWHEFGGRLRVGLNNWILKECPLLFLQSHGLAEFSSSPN